MKTHFGRRFYGKPGSKRLRYAFEQISSTLRLCSRNNVNIRTNDYSSGLEVYATADSFYYWKTNHCSIGNFEVQATSRLHKRGHGSEGFGGEHRRRVECKPSHVPTARYALIKHVFVTHDASGQHLLHGILSSNNITEPCLPVLLSLTRATPLVDSKALKLLRLFAGLRLRLFSRYVLSLWLLLLGRLSGLNIQGIIPYQRLHVT